ncbi:MAG: DUF4160 domain-containing protein [Bacteroidales bacterium]|nr:DUF4160 domain-containing protein [Bacteroidales bacterium]
MPELFRFFGYVFFFYSREHEPIHVHVEGNGGEAKYSLDEQTGLFVLQHSVGIKANDLKKIERIITDNTAIIKQAWKVYFNEDD